MTKEMSTHASMYIPLSVPPTRLPQYVRLDRNSQWHTSALLSAALESVTLPTRLRHDTQKCGFVDGLEAALNVNGNQRIAQLQCSVLDPETAPYVIAIPRGSTDDRAPSGNNRLLVEEDGLNLAGPRLDMDLSCCNARSTSPFAAQHDRSDHFFGAVESVRTKSEAAKDETTDDVEITYALKRRRFAGLPVIERFHSSLEYPLLDSFPPIFSLSPGLTQFAVHTSLSTTSGISKRVKALQSMVSRMADFDERETLSNRLGEIGEAYEDGWHSGSDESDD
ncbi:MAG: mtDNA inheritance, partitioning of the mitochondrial organelle [Alectoria fallacina]|uniref:MtDNA inheritance, partitioning of the mitochondrial organelle n=1 Tax=Alectoria fallacina TaxID=1903189 RepID=A0A8H3FPK6_9LECA|nr:MAG: mtDNA inheritance, partitioning of the mitochondrial organelle [Alectoria fallacina]